MDYDGLASTRRCRFLTSRRPSSTDKGVRRFRSTWDSFACGPRAALRPLSPGRRKSPQHRGRRPEKATQKRLTETPNSSVESVVDSASFLASMSRLSFLVSRFSFPGVPNVDSTGWYSSSGSTEMKNPLNNNNKDDQPRPRSSPSRSARADSAVEFLRISWCITLHHPSSPLIARLCFVYTVCRASRAWQARRGSWPRSPRDPRSR